MPIGCWSCATATILDEIELGRRADHEARPLITRLAELGL